MLIPIPPAMLDRVRALEHPVQARDAATIAVVREGDAGIEVFLMRRRASMAFAAGMHVFPGGTVSVNDAAPLPWAGPGPQHFAARLRCEADIAHSLVVAAVRETFEETGVLLAGPDEHSVVEDAAVFDDSRAALEQHELTFSNFLRQHDLVLRADLLAAWGHWITPSYAPRRYDTRFFVAVMPEGQRIDSVNTEADGSLWAPVSQMLESVELGHAAMMAPTSVTCKEIANESAGSVLHAAEQREIRPIEPRVVEIDGQLWFETESPDHL